MKKTQIIYFILFALLGGLVGYFLSSNVSDDVSQDEIAKVAVESIAALDNDLGEENVGDAQTPFVIRDHVPAGVGDAQHWALDLDGDGSVEHAVLYRDKNVARSTYDIRTIEYLNIYQLNGSEWEAIKTDEVTNSGGTVDTNFCRIQVIDKVGDRNEAFLVSKCGRGSSSFYIYGESKDGVIEDWPIAKGYLHAEDYLENDDQYISLVGVSVSDEGVSEFYGVQCPARHFNFNPYCRTLELLHPFVNGFPEGVEVVENSWNFGEPQELVYTSEHLALSGLMKKAEIKFRVPVSYELKDKVEEDGLALAFKDGIGIASILTGSLTELYSEDGLTCASILDAFQSAELVSCNLEGDSIHFLFEGAGDDVGFVKGVAFVEEEIPVMITTYRVYDTHWDDAVIEMVRSNFSLELVD